jgi:hypothetical protein
MLIALGVGLAGSALPPARAQATSALPFGETALAPSTLLDSGE